MLRLSPDTFIILILNVIFHAMSTNYFHVIEQIWRIFFQSLGNSQGTFKIDVFH